MAQLTAEQQKQVEAWAEAGATLNDIQTRLKSDFAITLTYLEARMLMMDVGVRIKDKPKADPVPEVPAAASSPAEDPALDADLPMDEPEPTPPQGGVGVSVTADRVAVPGAIASGKATFSDGKTATWYVDQFGRLGVKASEPGYKPPPQDIPLFEQQLDALLSSL